MTAEVNARRNGPSIARKLQALVLAAVLAATMTVGGLSLWTELGRYADAKRDSLVATAQVFASVVSKSTADLDRQGANRVLRAIARMPDIAYARVETVDGRLLAEMGGGLRLETDVRIAGEDRGLDIGRLLTTSTIETSTPIMQGGRKVGQFVLIARATDLRERVMGILFRSMLACVVALALGLFIAARLQKTITGPIASLDAAVARIRASQSFDAPVTATSNDEVGRLVDGFNAMMGEIRARDDRIDAHLKGLEREVDARTKDLRVARDAAELANRAKSDFLATMSHEIRTPMNGVMVMAELLAAGDLAERPRRYADVIVRSGKSLLAIINDLLDFSKIEAGKLELESTRVDLVEVIDQVASLFWERAQGKGIDFATYIAPDAPRFVIGDSVRIGQIVTNLVTNALKFTEHGYVLVTVTKDPRREGSIRIAVRDTGVGIARDKLAGVFAAFTQADQSTTRKFGGTGLGLTICRRLARAMGGDIGVSSDLGKGSTFAAHLPLPPAEDGDAWPVLGEPRSVIVDSALPATRRVITQYLRAAGYDIPQDPTGDPLAANLVIADPERLQNHPRRQGAQRIVLRALGDATADRLLADGAADAALDLPLLRADMESILAEIVAGGLRPQRVRTTAAAALGRYAGRTVLVVDDNAVNREVAIESLSRFGVAADTAENGRIAVEMATARAYDLILMDGSMPEMDGYQATAAIRAHEAGTGGARTPIVAATADVLGTSSDAWREVGADGVLHKPFTLQALGAHLAAHFGAPDSAAEEEDGGEAAAPAPETASDPFAHLAEFGAPDFVQRVVGLYLDQAPKRLGEIGAALTAGDQDAAARAAHAIKSMSLSLGAKVVADLAAHAERRVRIDGAEITQSDLATLRAALEDTIGLLNAKLRPSGAKVLPGRVGLAAELEAAIRNDTLTLQYQPIFDRGGQNLLGFEALMRWSRANGVSVGAQDVVRCAEDCGLTTEMGDWAIDRAARDAASWPGAFVSVNASPVQLTDPQFDKRLLSTLEKHGMNPRRFVLEITEQSTLEADGAVIELISRLRAGGVQIALDDFGTGYSSLTHLRRLPIDKLKIDKSFVTDIGDGIEGATIIHAVASIGRTLGFQIVAEGVETADQHAFLRAAGVHAMQGWFFGKAMPVNEAAALVARQAAGAA